jgi:pimeloyl-ACP methyl ester carboxylesterase
METTDDTSATVVLIHGAWHGAWCWDRVVALLETANIPTVAVDLPGHGASTEPLGDLYTHTAYVHDLLDGIDGPIVLCGHSYGGAVISEAAAGVDTVHHLVYLCAIVPTSASCSALPCPMPTPRREADPSSPPRCRCTTTAP